MRRDISTSLLQAGIDVDLIDIHRSGFQRVPTDDKPRSRNGAVIVLSARPLRIWFENHATGIRGMYNEGGDSNLPSKAEFQRIIRARQQAKAEREASQAEVAARAEALWRSAKRADPDHPYLVRKQVGAHSIRQIDDDLLIPLRFAGRMCSLQTIEPDGSKRFLYGGRVSGCNHGIGVPANTLLIAEGYATAATLHEVLELGVAIAFNAGNLRPVAVELHRRYPQSRIVIAADNDRYTPNNPGVRCATEAAAAVGGVVVAPNFSMAALRETDWNDYRIRYGAAALKACFSEVYAHVG